MPKDLQKLLASMSALAVCIHSLVYSFRSLSSRTRPGAFGVNICVNCAALFQKAIEIGSIIKVYRVAIAIDTLALSTIFWT